MLIAYPDANLYTVCDFLAEEHRGLLVGRTPKTTFVQRLPFAATKHWLYLPLMPIAIEQLDMSEYDIVLSSCYSVAKGVLTSPDQVHVSYIHTPIRYAWHLQHQYLTEMNLTRGVSSAIARVLMHYIRTWDLRSAIGVDRFIANSRYVARQVTRLYKEPCVVLHPPADLERFSMVSDKQNYYVTASRLVPYKRIDLIVKAFARMPQHKLIVIGDGPERKRVDDAAKGHSNIQILGYQSDDVYTSTMSNAKAFVFAAIEDFGIAPVEAQACGTAVIALAKGGALETVRPLGVESPTGIFFYEQTEEAIMSAVEQFEREGYRILPTNCRKNSEGFGPEQFRTTLQRLVGEAYESANVETAFHSYNYIPQASEPEEFAEYAPRVRETVE